MGAARGAMRAEGGLSAARAPSGTLHARLPMSRHRRPHRAPPRAPGQTPPWQTGSLAPWSPVRWSPEGWRDRVGAGAGRRRAPEAAGGAACGGGGGARALLPRAHLMKRARLSDAPGPSPGALLASRRPVPAVGWATAAGRAVPAPSAGAAAAAAAALAPTEADVRATRQELPNMSVVAVVRGEGRGVERRSRGHETPRHPRPPSLSQVTSGGLVPHYAPSAGTRAGGEGKRRAAGRVARPPTALPLPPSPLARRARRVRRGLTPCERARCVVCLQERVLRVGGSAEKKKQTRGRAAGSGDAPPPVPPLP